MHSRNEPERKNLLYSGYGEHKYANMSHQDNVTGLIRKYYLTLLRYNHAFYNIAFFYRCRIPKSDTTHMIMVQRCFVPKSWDPISWLGCLTKGSTGICEGKGSLIWCMQSLLCTQSCGSTIRTSIILRITGQCPSGASSGRVVSQSVLVFRQPSICTKDYSRSARDTTNGINYFLSPWYLE